MLRSTVHRLALLFVLLALFAVLVGACRVEKGPTPASLEILPSQPTRQASLPVVQPTRMPAKSTQPSSTLAPETATETPMSPEVAFTLTILHTGEVYGEVLPCG